MYRYNLSLASISPQDYCTELLLVGCSHYWTASLFLDGGMGISIFGYRTHPSCSGRDECRYYTAWTQENILTKGIEQWKDNSSACWRFFRLPPGHSWPGAIQPWRLKPLTSQLWSIWISKSITKSGSRLTGNSTTCLKTNKAYSNQKRWNNEKYTIHSVKSSDSNDAVYGYCCASLCAWY